MNQFIQRKMSSYGIVEIRRRSSDLWYVLYVGGKYKTQSASLDYIVKEYNRYR